MSNTIGSSSLSNMPQKPMGKGEFKQSKKAMPKDAFVKQEWSGGKKFLGLRMVEKFRDSKIGQKLIQKDTKASIAGGTAGTYAGGTAGLMGAVFLGGVIGGATGLGVIPAAALFIEEVMISGIGMSIGGAAGAVVGSNIGKFFGKITGLGNKPSGIK